MRVARIAVLDVAVSAGGLAFMLAGRAPASATVAIVKQATDLADLLLKRPDADAQHTAGTLSHALRSLADSLPKALRGPEEDQIRRSNSVNIVRYGVTSIQSAK